MSAAPPLGVSLSRIAHDLRSPLMPLRTAAWLLSNEPGASERVVELADIVDRQSVRMARMLEELSEWGRFTAPDTRMRPEPIEATLAVDMAIGGVADCHVEPRFTGEAADLFLFADQHWFSKLLGTLIEHATFRDSGNPPEILVTSVSRRLQIRVRDHGEPLDDTRRGALLSEPQSTPFDEGLGLRLLVARSIAEAHGGSLRVDEAMEHGLELICELPTHDPRSLANDPTQEPHDR